MSNSLTMYDKYKIIRPVIGGCEYDKNDFPIIKNQFDKEVNWNSFYATGVQNINKWKNNKEAIALMYLDDKKLLRFWNEPLKKVALFQRCAMVATPDYSCYKSMNANDIRHNVYMNRWLGATWQNYGVRILPTIGWAGEDTYELCLSAIEKGTPVTISTLGCQNNQEDFLKGFDEMKKRISPSLIVVYGNMIPGMTG